MKPDQSNFMSVANYQSMLSPRSVPQGLTTFTRPSELTANKQAQQISAQNFAKMAVEGFDMKEQPKKSSYNTEYLQTSDLLGESNMDAGEPVENIYQVPTLMWSTSRVRTNSSGNRDFIRGDLAIAPVLNVTIDQNTGKALSTFTSTYANTKNLTTGALRAIAGDNQADSDLIQLKAAAGDPLKTLAGAPVTMAARDTLSQIVKSVSRNPATSDTLTVSRF
jgi:hypothetical protein